MRHKFQKKNIMDPSTFDYFGRHVQQLSTNCVCVSIKTKLTLFNTLENTEVKNTRAFNCAEIESGRFKGIFCRFRFCCFHYRWELEPFPVLGSPFLRDRMPHETLQTGFPMTLAFEPDTVLLDRPSSL